MKQLPTNSGNGRRHAATEADHERFLERHRKLLLRHLDGKAPGRPGEEPDALQYIENVLTEWHELFETAELPAPDARETTFWFALYQLEELVEIPVPYAHRHVEPYVKMQMKTLAEVRELLRHRQPLPLDRFLATRPDGTM